MRSTFKSRLGVGLVAGLLAVGEPSCGSQPDANGAPSPALPSAAATASASSSAGSGRSTCEIFSRSDVEAVMGRPVDEGKAIRGPVAAEGCQYFGTGGALASFDLLVYRGNSLVDARRAFEFMGGEHWQPLTGLGDQAKFSVSGMTAGVAVRQGSLALSIAVVEAASNPTEASLKELASRALSRA